jgi:hypothetical protein
VLSQLSATIPKPALGVNYTKVINLSTTAGKSEMPRIGVSADSSHIYVIWVDQTLINRDVFFRRSIDGGATFGPVLNLSNQSGGAIDPQITTSGNKIVYIAWEHAPNHNGQLFFRRSIDGGATFGPVLNLSNNTGLMGAPQIYAAPRTNTVYAVWHDASRGILFRKSVDGGATFFPQVNLSNRNESTSFYPQIAVSGDKNVYVVWQHNIEGQDTRIVFRKSVDGGATFFPQVNLSNKNESTSFYPRIAVSGDKNVYVVWYNGIPVGENFPPVNNVFFTRSIDGGSTFGAPLNLSNTTGWSTYPDVAAYNNSVYVVWVDNVHAKNGQIILRKSNDTGATFSNSILIDKNDNGGSSAPTLAMFNKKIIVLWYDSNNTSKDQTVDASISIDGGKNFERLITLGNQSGGFLDPRIAVPQNVGNKHSNTNLYVVWKYNIKGNDEIAFLKALPESKKTNPSTLNKLPVDNSNLLSAKDINNNTYVPDSGKAAKIALVEPTFTTAAYDNAFYMFYNLYNNITTDVKKNITEYTDLLSNVVPNRTLTRSDVSSSPISQASYESAMYVYSHLKSLAPRSNISILTDVDVDDGSIFANDNRTNAYDTLVLGHQEYVTQNEYSNLKRFVANGGTIFLLDSNIFFAEVKYDKTSKIMTLAKGHYWGYNGKSAWREAGERWQNETSGWIGSNYFSAKEIMFANNPFSYAHHEEQYLTNPNDIILLNYNGTVPNYKKQPKPIFASYQLEYGKGRVIALGIYSDDIITDNRFNLFLDSLLLEYGLRIPVQK